MTYYLYCIFRIWSTNCLWGSVRTTKLSSNNSRTLALLAIPGQRSTLETTGEVTRDRAFASCATTGLFPLVTTKVIAKIDDSCSAADSCLQPLPYRTTPPRFRQYT